MSTQPTKEEMMQTIPMTPQTVALFRKFVEHPEECEGCDYKPIRECFEKSDTCTPQHILFNEYIAYLKRPLPKVFFYIIMDEIYPELKGNAESKYDADGNYIGGGEIGFYLKCIVKPEKKED